MAVYDPEAKKLVIRLVYDGPGMAGKTTNLQQLCSFFTTQRRSELYTGATTGERTLCLDWLQLDGGLVRGHELRCHLISVPGQAVLSRRRQLLLALADATVFVTESTPAALDESRSMWDSMLACTGGPEAGVPVVLQANKQDQHGALGVAEIRERWGLDSRIPIVTAQASAGTGVRETVVLGIRATAVELQEKLQGNGVDELAGRYETGEELERRMLEEERARPMSAVDVVLAAHGMNDAGAAVIGTEPVVVEPVVHDAPSGDNAEEGNALSDSKLEELPVTRRVGRAEGPRPEVTAEIFRPSRDHESNGVSEAERSGLAVVAPAPAELSFAAASVAVALHDDDDVRAQVDAGEQRAEGSEPVRREPVLPDANMHHGLVWPPAEGRKTLRRVPVSEAVPRAQPARPGAPSSLVYEAGIWRLKTSPARCYPDPDQARKELLRLAHMQLELGKLRVPRTVLAVQTDEDGGSWLWTVSLWLTTVRNQMTYAAETGDESALGRSLELYTSLAIRGLRMCLDSGVVLDVAPENFGVLSGEGFYLEDEVARGGVMPRAGQVLLSCFDDYAEHPAALDQYQAELVRGLSGKFRAGELHQLGVGEAIAGARVETDRARRAQAELTELLLGQR